MGGNPTIPVSLSNESLMAKHLDLEEQEQIDQLKHFWKTYGNLITWVLIVVFGAIAAWNGFNYWQRSQATQSAAMYDEVEKAARANDVVRLERAFADMKERFGKTTYAQQAALLTSKALLDSGKADGAEAALSWLAESASDPAYRSIARLRLSSLMMDRKAYDAAMKLLTEEVPKEFAPLVADRKGDLFALTGKKAEAITEYQRALALMDKDSDYRRIVEVKLGAAGGASSSAINEKPPGKTP